MSGYQASPSSLVKWAKWAIQATGENEASAVKEEPVANLVSSSSDWAREPNH